jgi:hypothetical protein
MSIAPRFEYFLSHKKNPVRKDSRIWSAPLPLNRHQVAKPLRQEPSILVRHGDYFYAARDFLEKNRFEIVARAISQRLHRNIKPQEIEEIRICLEKHGEFYHPAKIETILKGITIPFVLNVAVSGAGKSCVQREYRLLKRLNADFPFSFLPRVFDLDYVSIQDDEIGMFLGEWFEDFNEFHISFDPSDKKYKIVVWDHEHGNYFLTTAQTMELYRKVARILTCYYNVETFEQILSWHHGAGDFILKCQNHKIDIKLITVRQYRPMFENNGINKDPDAELILEALLVFFLNLAIKMRLDRLDGVGEIVWSDDIAVQGTLKGFFEGLDLKPQVSLFTEPLADCFRIHLLSCTYTDLLDLNRSIAKTYHPKAPETPVIRQHLDQHVDDLYYAIRQYKKYP